MKLRSRTKNPLLKRAKKGFRGYPVGTIAFYGPDDQRASKVAVGIVVAAETEPVELRRWFAETGDARNDMTIAAEIPCPATSPSANQRRSSYRCVA